MPLASLPVKVSVRWRLCCMEPRAARYALLAPEPAQERKAAPICTASAPSASAATRPRPSETPPAAITGAESSQVGYRRGEALRGQPVKRGLNGLDSRSPAGARLWSISKSLLRHHLPACAPPSRRTTSPLTKCADSRKSSKSATSSTSTIRLIGLSCPRNRCISAECIGVSTAPGTIGVRSGCPLLRTQLLMLVPQTPSHL